MCSLYKIIDIFIISMTYLFQKITLQDDGHFICLVTYIDAQALSNLHFGWIYDNEELGKSDFILVRLSSSINPASESALADLGFTPRYAMMNYPDSKIFGTNMGPTLGQQDPGGSQLGPMSLAIWVTTWEFIMIITAHKYIPPTKSQ